MKIIPVSNLENFSLPLPIYKSIKIAEALSKDGEEFSIFVGLDENLVAQLKKLSTDMFDTELQKNTSDLKRFSGELYEEWYKKSRTPFALVHKKTDALSALVWFGPKPLHEGCECHAAAWRSYNPFRGKGLMKNFVAYVMDVYQKNLPGVKFWIKAKKENLGSADLATALGFTIDTKFSDENHIVMSKGF